MRSTQAQAAARRQGQRILSALWEMLNTYLPLVLMALLALFTWWLVRNTPIGTEPRPPQAPRHEPDYVMERFMLRHFAPAQPGANQARAEGQPLQYEIEGRLLRHYPDTDTVEIDDIVVRWMDPAAPARAQARRAEVDMARRHVRLLGGARFEQEAPEGAPDQRVIVQSEELVYDGQANTLTAPAAVDVERAGSAVRAAGLRYEVDRGRALFQGPVRAALLPAVPVSPGARPPRTVQR